MATKIDPIMKPIKISPVEKPIIKKPIAIKKPIVPVAKKPVAKPAPATAVKPPVAATPTTPDLNQYLTSDTTYQSQLAAINKALGDYQANELSSEGDYNASYAQNKYDMARANTQNTQDQADDYSGRGLYRSGLYGKAYGDLQEDYASKQSALDQSRQTYVGGLQRDMSNYTSSQSLAQQQARQDAINRRTLALLTNTAS